ncbi:unnamed protein product, partial [Rotaria sordida]
MVTLENMVSAGCPLEP